MNCLIFLYLKYFPNISPYITNVNKAATTKSLDPLGLFFSECKLLSAPALTLSWVSLVCAAPSSLWDSCWFCSSSFHVSFQFWPFHIMFSSEYGQQLASCLKTLFSHTAGRSSVGIHPAAFRGTVSSGSLGKGRSCQYFIIKLGSFHGKPKPLEHFFVRAGVQIGSSLL